MLSPVVTVVEGVAVGWRQAAAVLVQLWVIESVDPFESGDSGSDQWVTHGPQIEPVDETPR